MFALSLCLLRRIGKIAFPDQAPRPFAQFFFSVQCTSLISFLSLYVSCTLGDLCWLPEHGLLLVRFPRTVCLACLAYFRLKVLLLLLFQLHWRLTSFIQWAREAGDVSSSLSSSLRLSGTRLQLITFPAAFLGTTNRFSQKQKTAGVELLQSWYRATTWSKEEKSSFSFLCRSLAKFQCFSLSFQCLQEMSSDRLFEGSSRAL